MRFRRFVARELLVWLRPDQMGLVENRGTEWLKVEEVVVWVADRSMSRVRQASGLVLG